MLIYCRLDLDKLQWSAPAPPLTLPQGSPPARSFAVSGDDSAASNRHSHLVIGGKGADGKALSDAWVRSIVIAVLLQLKSSHIWYNGEFELVTEGAELFLDVRGFALAADGGSDKEASLEERLYCPCTDEPIGSGDQDLSGGDCWHVERDDNTMW